jgi:hypothetical protein
MTDLLIRQFSVNAARIPAQADRIKPKRLAQPWAVFLGELTSDDLVSSTWTPTVITAAAADRCSIVLAVSAEGYGFGYGGPTSISILGGVSSFRKLCSSRRYGHWFVDELWLLDFLDLETEGISLFGSLPLTLTNDGAESWYRIGVYAVYGLLPAVRPDLDRVVLARTSHVETPDDPVSIEISSTLSEVRRGVAFVNLRFVRFGDLDFVQTTGFTVDSYGNTSAAGSIPHVHAHKPVTERDVIQTFSATFTNTTSAHAVMAILYSPRSVPVIP